MVIDEFRIEHDIINISIDVGDDGAFYCSSLTCRYSYTDFMLTNVVDMCRNVCCIVVMVDTFHIWNVAIDNYRIRYDGVDMSIGVGTYVG